MKNNLFYILIFCFLVSCNSSNNPFFSLGEKYEDVANSLKEKTYKGLGDIITLLNFSDKGVKIRTFYICEDTVFSDNCSLYRRMWFDEAGKVVSDTVFTLHPLAQNCQYSDKKIIVTTSRYAQSAENPPLSDIDKSKNKNRTDSLLLDDANRPVALYSDGFKRCIWKYDSAGRIIYYRNKAPTDIYYNENTYHYLADTILHIAIKRSYLSLDTTWCYYIFDKQNRISKEITYSSDITFFYELHKAPQFDSIDSYIPYRKVGKEEYFYETKKIVRKIYEYESEDKLFFTIIMETSPNNKIQKITTLNEDDIVFSERYFEYDGNIQKQKSRRNGGETWETTTMKKISDNNIIIEKEEIKEDFYEYYLCNPNGFLIKKIEINPDYTRGTFTIDEKY